jgi:hypothetical protein
MLGWWALDGFAVIPTAAVDPLERLNQPSGVFDRLTAYS